VEVDVVIVGGGPAGVSAAIALVGAGVSTAVIDDGPRREKAMETAPPGLRQLLERIVASKALAACEPCFGIESRWGGLPKFQSSILNPKGHAWFVRRAEFDRSLQEAAQEQGVVWLRASARDVSFFGDWVRVWGDGLSVEAKWVVFASGSHLLPAKVTRQLPQVIDQLICYWAVVPSESKEKVLALEPADYGWWYSCPGSSGTVFAGLVTDALDSREHEVASLPKWNILLRGTKLYLDRKVVGPASRLNVQDAALSTLPKRSGDRWTAIGDAALRLDPLGSSGVMAAIESGIRAAESILQAIRRKSKMQADAPEWYSGLLARFLEERLAQYSLEGQRRSSGFWRRRMVVRLTSRP
jgi:flavin-dependent dehydrogenase